MMCLSYRINSVSSLRIAVCRVSFVVWLCTGNIYGVISSALGPTIPIVFFSFVPPSVVNALCARSDWANANSVCGSQNVSGRELRGLHSERFVRDRSADEHDYLKYLSTIREKYVIETERQLTEPSTGKTLAIEHELFFFDVGNQIWRAEQRRWIPSQSDDHPSNISITFSLPDRWVTFYRSFSFEGEQIIAQPPVIFLIDPAAEAVNYGLYSPFFGPFIQNLDSLYELFRSNDDFLVDGALHSAVAEWHDHGEFEIHLDSEHHYRPARLIHRLRQGDRIRGNLRLGVIEGQPMNLPQLPLSSLLEWFDIVYEGDGATARPIKAKLRSVNRLNNGETHSFLHHVNISYRPAVSIDPDRLEWEASQLTISNGSPVAAFPPDHRRIEFIDGEIKVVVDKRAREGLEDIQPRQEGGSGNYRMLWIAGTVALFLLFVSCAFALWRWTAKWR